MLTEVLSSLGGKVTDIQYAPLDSRLFVILQPGVIKAISSGATVSTILDITDRVNGRGSRGLLGVAFHPNYATNRYFFVYYGENSGQNMRISRFTTSVNTSSTELIMAEIPFPDVHRGGQIRFGHSDNYLYIATGDGSIGGIPVDNGDDLTTYWGKILRVDVDNVDESATVSVGKPRWKIPQDNVRCRNIDSNALGEIVAYGLRNPWRFGFDRSTGDLWLADVGEVQREEINFISKNQFLTECHNFGWHFCEGTIAFDPPLPPGCSSCSDESCFVVPIMEYGRSAARSITGGIVYRGNDFTEALDGMYIFGDYATGNLWGAKWNGNAISTEIEQLNAISAPITFGEDANGELFVGNADGYVYRVEYDNTTSTEPPTEAPQTGALDCPGSLVNSFDITADLRLYYEVVMAEAIEEYGGLFCAALVYQGEGWVGLAASNSGNMEGSLAIIGLPDVKAVKKHYLLTASVGSEGKSRTLVDATIEQGNGVTTMKFGKLLQEEGEVPIDINDTIFLWAHGDSNTLSSHGMQNRGSFSLQPSAEPSPVAHPPQACSFWFKLLNWILRIITFGAIDLRVC